MKCYALYNFYGNIARSSFNNHPGYEVFRFNSRKERDEWLSEHTYRDVNVVAWPCTRKEADEMVFHRLDKGFFKATKAFGGAERFFLTREDFDEAEWDEYEEE